jgi:GNAT superfamily N-acetyltransferase
MRTSANSAVVAEARGARDLADCRALFGEYQRGLGVDLCFQGFAAELAGLPGDYAPPRGRLLLARDGAQAVGCVALRPLEHRDCEMKRLYVRPSHRGTGLGRALAERIVAEARAMGYECMKLDTLARLESAVALYQSMGFVETPRYNDNPVEGVRFLALDLVPRRLPLAPSGGS